MKISKKNILGTKGKYLLYLRFQYKAYFRDTSIKQRIETYPFIIGDILKIISETLPLNKGLKREIPNN